MVLLRLLAVAFARAACSMTPLERLPLVLAVAREIDGGPAGGTTAPSGPRAAERAVRARAAERGASAARGAKPRRPLEELLLVLTVAREDRLYLTARYARFFGGVAYVVWPRSDLQLAACASRGVACLAADDRTGARTGAYALLLAALAADARPPWLAAAWPRAAPPAGVLVAHLDFWLQPRPLARRIDGGALSTEATWTLAAGLNAPPAGPPPAPQHLRVYGKGCLDPRDAERERDWTWGHGVRELALGALSAANATLFPTFSRICATHTDLFYVPRRAFAAAAAGCAAFCDVSHEVAVPTVLRAVAARLRLREDFLDCWGCSQSWASDPSLVAGRLCGHKLDLRVAHVRDFWRDLLDAQAPRARDAALEARIAALDADQGARGDADWRAVAAPKPCCRDRTHGCCRVPGRDQTACACVARDPPRPPGAATSRCGGAVSSRVSNATRALAYNYVPPYISALGASL